MTRNKLPYIVLALTGIAFLVGYCNRKNQDFAGGVDVAHKPEQTRQRNILNVDSLNSATEAKIRAAIDSAVEVTETHQIKEKIVYKYIRVKDEQLEADYKSGTATADSVISSKNNRIAKAETLLARSDSLRGQDSLKIGSYERELEGKNGAIRQLSSTIDGTVGEIERLQVKVQRRNKLLKIGGGVIAVIAGVIAIK